VYNLTLFLAILLLFCLFSKETSLEFLTEFCFIKHCPILTFTFELYFAFSQTCSNFARKTVIRKFQLIGQPASIFIFCRSGQKIPDRFFHHCSVWSLSARQLMNNSNDGRMVVLLGCTLSNVAKRTTVSFTCLKTSASGAGGMRYKSRADQISYVASDSPPLQS